MNILIFEYNNFGTEDVKECLEKKGYKYTVVETDEYRTLLCHNIPLSQ